MEESEIFLRNVENYAKENCLDLTQLCRLAGVSNNYIQALKTEIKSLKEKKVNLEDLDIVVFMCRNKDEMHVEIDGEKVDLNCKEVARERGYITLELPYKSTTFYTANETGTNE